MTADAPDAGALAALAGLPYMTWDRIDRVLEAADGCARRGWEAVRAGAHGAALARAAGRVRPDDVARAHQAAGVAVLARGAEGYPALLEADHEAPPVLFSVGSLDGLSRPRVAVIGTRRCTNYGRDVARQLGRQLSDSGVCVVSGLAAGIDGAAHEGALASGGAPPVAVVGSGLDVVYPLRHARLWERVGQAGALLSEAPLGGRPEPWRFPARNRVIAALADVVVVVESHVTGGSMHTVRAAEERAVPVLAVPGPIKSRASGGTNLLLSQGCHPVCDVEDVLTALALCHAAALPPAGFSEPGFDEAAFGHARFGDARYGTAGYSESGFGVAGEPAPGGPPFAPEAHAGAYPHAGAFAAEAHAGPGPHAGGFPDAPAAGGGAPALRLVEGRATPPDEQAAVLDALEFTPVSLETVLARSGMPPARASAALAWLEREGWARSEAGWWERC